MYRVWLACLMVVVVIGCSTQTDDGRLAGRPGGPYEMSLRLEPKVPKAGEPSMLNFELRYASSGKPVRDLQVAHERLIHNFITDLSFSEFAHIHHEDFGPVTDHDLSTGSLRFPYTFERAGQFRIVSEFVHRDRSWTKHFDVVVDGEARDATQRDRSLTRRVGELTARLSVSPTTPIAGRETDLQVTFERAAEDVTDLQLYLGTELHGAVWRDDGEYFGHLHSFTPKVEAIMALAHDREVPPQERGLRISQMMTQLMCLEAELIFPGPQIPMRYVFPEPGLYHLFIEVAPGGKPVVFPFSLVVDGPVKNAPAEPMNES